MTRNRAGIGRRGRCGLLIGALALLAGAAPPPVRIFDPAVIPASSAGRELLVRVTAPVKLEGRLPVILFSHGAALSREQYAPIIDWWARHGFIVLQPDHEDAVVDGFPPPVPPSADLWRTRIIDMERLGHALDLIEAQVPELRGHIDRTKILAAGHSFGGHTVAALMGAKVWNERLKRYESFDDPQIRGAVLLSPPGDGGAALSSEWQKRGSFLNMDWKTMHGPMLIIVGSADTGKPMTVMGPAWHEDAYRESVAHGICQISLEGALHYLGGIVDPRRTGVEDADPHRLAAVRETSLALFRDALAGRAPSTADMAVKGTPATVECR